MSSLLVRANVKDGIPLADDSVHCVVTSPPYYALRDYGVDGQLGLEGTPAEYVANMVSVFREVRRVLRPDGSLWLNIGDSYQCGKGAQGNGTKDSRNSARRIGTRPTDRQLPGLRPKDLIGIPWMLAFALRDDGWRLRGEQIWHKVNVMPESVRDRPCRAHEHVFLLTKKSRYYYDEVAERQPQKTLGKRHEGKSGYREGHPSKGGIKTRALNPLGGALRSVWPISSRPFKGAHFATMPVELALRCVRLGSSSKGCCPACGSPWRQVIERTRVATRPGRDTKLNGVDLNAMTGRIDDITGYRDPRRHATTVRVLGWESTCGCMEREPVPCLVLDPFNGAATSGVAAEACGRDYVGIDLSAEYLAISAERLTRPHAPARKPTAGQAQYPLFEAKS